MKSELSEPAIDWYLSQLDSASRGYESLVWKWQPLSVPTPVGDISCLLLGYILRGLWNELAPKESRLLPEGAPLIHGYPMARIFREHLIKCLIFEIIKRSEKLTKPMNLFYVNHIVPRL
jgi:hypothetical protein